MEESLDQLTPILPIDFFHITVDAKSYDPKGKWRKEHCLPAFSQLLLEAIFATVSMGVHDQGLYFRVEFDCPFSDCRFPDYRKGDSVELFIDTRDLKSSGFLTKFCHHFVFLPQDIDGVRASEVTTFQTDDRHNLCDPSELEVKSTFKRSGYEMEIFIPRSCLFGYDLQSFDRMGFTYRINRRGGDPQHFALSSAYLAVEKESKRWSTIYL